MKIRKLLEKLTAPVWINTDKKLHVISGLVEKEFGLHFKNIRGGCFVSQIVFSLAHSANIPYGPLVSHVNESDLRGPLAGVTLEQLFDVFNHKPIKISKKKTLSFDLSVETHTLDGAINEVKGGQPVIFIVSRSIQDRFDNTKYYSYCPDTRQPDGIADLNSNTMSKDVSDQSTWHAYMLIGYDEDGLLIIRDMRSIYSYNGYIKAKVSQLQTNPNAYKLISVVVNSVEENTSL